MHFPMWLIHAADFLRLSELQPHQTLRDLELLVA